MVSFEIDSSKKHDYCCINSNQLPGKWFPGTKNTLESCLTNIVRECFLFAKLLIIVRIQRFQGIVRSDSSFLGV